MAGKHNPKVLFWIDGRVPSSEQRDEANELVGIVVFRNAKHVATEGALEDFDGLAGPAIPQRYAAELARREAKPFVVEKPAPKEGVVGPSAASGTNQATAKSDGAWTTGKVTKGQAK